MSRRRIFDFLILAIVSFFGVAAFAQTSVNSEPPLDADANEQLVQVPGGYKNGALMQTTIFRPPGSGPFPLLIMNHGKDPTAPRKQGRDRFLHLARSFVQRGYAVIVPMRLGFAGSSGRAQLYSCDLAKVARDQAHDIVDVLRFARSQPWVDRDRIVVGGQSLGGLVSLAFATKEFPGVRGIINFAGGLKDSECAWQKSLQQAFSEFGKNNQIPSLWIYGQNDSLFGPDLVARLYRAFESAGGRARLFQYSSFKNDAHGMVADRDGELVWRETVEDFLSAISMPTQILFELPPLKSPPESGFAPLEAVDAVPFLGERGKAAYKKYLTFYSPRAFAISANGSWAYAELGEDPNHRAIKTCEATAKQPCWLYSVDDKVVWKTETSSP